MLKQDILLLIREAANKKEPCIHTALLFTLHLNHTHNM
jgi:hypothetical protein